MSQKFTKGADLTKGGSVSALSPEPAVPEGGIISENKNITPKLEKKHWLEAESQLFGGVERESQMHPGSSLFTTEH